MNNISIHIYLCCRILLIIIFFLYFACKLYQLFSITLTMKNCNNNYFYCYNRNNTIYTLYDAIKIWLRDNYDDQNNNNIWQIAKNHETKQTSPPINNQNTKIRSIKRLRIIEQRRYIFWKFLIYIHKIKYSKLWFPSVWKLSLASVALPLLEGGIE